MNIAIDGPAGAGKSTIAKLLAQKLGFLYLDTGAMYRAIGLKVFENGVSAGDEKSVEELLEKTELDIIYDGGVQKIILDGKDVSAAIREHNISTYASDVSKIKAVRLKMVDMQREIASKQNCILDGRDIGTFVLPNADLKIFLTANVSERAKRRWNELRAKGVDCDLEQIKKDIETRDYNDSHRDFAPLRQAEDAVAIDTSDMTIERVADKITELVKSE